MRLLSKRTNTEYRHETNSRRSKAASHEVNRKGRARTPYELTILSARSPNKKRHSKGSWKTLR
jgi:hypothetical protein